MAKDLVRTRNYVTRFIEMKTHLNAVSLKMQTIKSHQAMAEAMKGVTKALTQMNKKISLPGLQKIMIDFMRENEKSEVMQETMGDTLDDAMEEEGTSTGCINVFVRAHIFNVFLVNCQGSAAEEDIIVNQVLDELGVGMGEAVPDAPTHATAATASAEATSSAAGTISPCS